MSPTYLQHFSEYLKRLVGRTSSALDLVHSSYIWGFPLIVEMTFHSWHPWSSSCGLGFGVFVGLHHLITRRWLSLGLSGFPESSTNAFSPFLSWSLRPPCGWPRLVLLQLSWATLMSPGLLTFVENRTYTRYVPYVARKDEPKMKAKEESTPRPKFWDPIKNSWVCLFLVHWNNAPLGQRGLYLLITLWRSSQWEHTK